MKDRNSVWILKFIYNKFFSVLKVQIALRNYKSIAEYPVDMQKKIASKGWYETYVHKTPTS